jgi:Helix-turn-helix domain
MILMPNPASDPNRMLSTQDAAALLGLQPCTLAAWREDGSQPGLAFFKLGKAVRYRYADLLAFIETRKASSTLTARQMGPPPTPQISRTRTGSPHSPPAPAPVSASAETPQEPWRMSAEKVRLRKPEKRGEDRQQSLF